MHVSLPTIPGALPHAQAGRLRALGVSGAKRSPAAPDVPTIAEAGVPGYESTNWYGIAAPAGTPGAIVAKLNREIGQIVVQPEVRAKLLSLGMETEASPPDKYAEYLRAEMAKWAKVIKATGLRIE
jgi:tripartite-type tricarboxylate transporter receptor subunit TctC